MWSISIENISISMVKIANIIHLMLIITLLTVDSSIITVPSLEGVSSGTYRYNSHIAMIITY